MSTISVVIPSYNHPDKIRRCVDSVLGQRGGGDFEVVVVDSSPEPVQRAVADALAGLDRLRLICRSDQTYPGTARNVGVDHARGEIIAFIDADCLAEADWLAAIRSAMVPGTMVAGVIGNGTPDDANGTSSYLVEFNEFLPFGGEPRRIAAAPTCNLAILRAEFLELGGFTDDRAFEDFLFCHAYTAGGGRILQHPTVRIRHLNKTELAPIVSNQRMLGRYSAIVRRKHGLPPRAVFRYPKLAYGLAPYRFTKILNRVRRAGQLRPFLRNARTISYLILEWTRGFYAGAVAASVPQLATNK